MTDTITRRDPDTGQRQQWVTEGNAGYWLDIPGDTAPMALPSEVAPMPTVPTQQPPAHPRTVEMLRGSHVDRAKAFEIRTRILALAFGGAGSMLWFIGRWVFPKLNGGDAASFGVALIMAVVVFVIIFITTWTGAFVLDTMTSPGGLGLFESWRTQRRLDRQSDAMVDAFRQVHGLDED